MTKYTGTTTTPCSRRRTANSVNRRNEPFLTCALTLPPVPVCGWGYEPRAHLIVGGHAIKVASHHRQGRGGRESSTGHCHEVFSRHRVNFGANFLLEWGFPTTKKNAFRKSTESGESEAKGVVSSGFTQVGGYRLECGFPTKHIQSRESWNIQKAITSVRILFRCRKIYDNIVNPPEESTAVSAARGCGSGVELPVRFKVIFWGQYELRL